MRFGGLGFALGPLLFALYRPVRPAATFPLLAAPSGEKAPENRICGGWGVFSLPRVWPTSRIRLVSPRAWNPQRGTTHHRCPRGREEGCQARLDGMLMLEIRGGYGVPPRVFYLRGDTALISPRVAWGHGEGMPPRGARDRQRLQSGLEKLPVCNLVQCARWAATP